VRESFVAAAASQVNADVLTSRSEMFAHAQGHAQHGAARRQRIARNPVDELAQLGFKRRHVELFIDVFQPLCSPIWRGIFRPDDAHAFRAPSDTDTRLPGASSSPAGTR